MTRAGEPVSAAAAFLFHGKSREELWVKRCVEANWVYEEEVAQLSGVDNPVFEELKRLLDRLIEFGHVPMAEIRCKERGYLVRSADIVCLPIVTGAVVA